LLKQKLPLTQQATVNQIKALKCILPYSDKNEREIHMQRIEQLENSLKEINRANRMM